MEHQPPSQDQDFEQPRDEWVRPAQASLTEQKTDLFSMLGIIAFIATLMLLAAILVPNFMRSRARGQLTACKSNLKNIGTALEMYSTDYSGRYPTSTAALMPNYLKTIPECPGAGKVTYVASFGPLAPMNDKKYEDYYYIECQGQNHKSVSVMGNFPAYNGIQGLIERDPAQR